MMEWRGRGLPYSFDLVYVWIEVCAFNLCILYEFKRMARAINRHLWKTRSYR